MRDSKIGSRLRNCSVVTATILALVGAQTGLAQAATATPSGPSFGPNSRDLATHTPIKHVPWIPERSATRLREADLNVLSKLGNQGLEWRLEPETFSGGEVGREDDLLDILVGCPVDIQLARQPST